ncbi:glycosyltransferase family 4 protein [Thiotrichales bacterium 19S3-7]|nr:glycosyltransferase family 4 protein [Thiotrichales bacterium 19S3-7]MCF6801974.1 glycosyltransferase family 4 protein [Thiotrichales bacterium 19S3-11]
MDRKIKPLIYIPHGAVPDQRGFAPAIVAMKQTELLSSKLFSPSILSALETLTPYQCYHQIPIYRYEHSKLYKKLFTKITKLNPYPLEKVAANYLKKIKADLLHIHQLDFNVNKFRNYNRHTPIILHAHISGRSYNEKLGEANFYIAASDFIKDRMIKNGFPKNKISVVSNAVDTTIFTPLTDQEINQYKHQNQISNKLFVITFAGRKQNIKGFHTFLAMLDKLTKKYPHVIGIAIGADINENNTHLESYKNAYQLRSKLKKDHKLLDLEPCSHQSLNQWFNISNVIVCPSLAEPQGMIMIEAMSSGSIIISNRVGGIAKSVIDQQTGILLDDFENADLYAQKIDDIITNPSDYSFMKSNARSHILENYTWQKWVNKLENIYIDVLGHKV